MTTNYATIRVELGERWYPIVIGRGTLQQADSLIEQQCGQSRHAAVIFDANVAEVANTVGSLLENRGWTTLSIDVPAGESSKCVQQAERLWQRMLTGKVDRGSIVIAVGGGVVGDLAGFAAATFARGLQLVQVPTTLLSQVDSSVGGKTGINLPGAKNIVGAFWQPRLVLIDIQTLQTLPRREYVSGLAEVVKYGMILWPDFFELLESNVPEILEQQSDILTAIIQRSCQAKAAVVGEDERETTGRRAILNYGHTFAHAIETLTGYGQFLHGEAVAIGMHIAATLACKLGRIDQSLVDRQRSLLRALGLPTSIRDIDPTAMWEAMQHDKKVAHGQLRFILPTRLGHVELVSDVPRSLVLSAIESSMEDAP
ncbi:MAG: 3-dehydroquinate synthase [Planctomycetota bacterium]|nr:MAG: 3-dehydroquinate synthase [Planctomycetota bacterium]